LLLLPSATTHLNLPVSPYHAGQAPDLRENAAPVSTAGAANASALSALE
jgi:hypothetical protein